ncbi:MAG: DNA repair protein RecN [Acidaminococcaceae bacterium]
MLMSLHVHNFALIEDAVIEFTPGFNVFTGETGAGKSILIDAFGIALGNRASAEYIRTGADAFWVQAVFDLTDNEGIKALLDEQGIDCQEDTLFLRRRIGANGKNQATINGVQVPLNLLHSVSEVLVDIHGQHENQQLLKIGAPLVLIDLFGGEELAQVLQTYQKTYQEYLQVTQVLAALKNQNEHREALLERLEWEVQEIEEAQLKIGEEEQLQTEAKQLTNSSKIMEAAADAYHFLNGDEEGFNGALLNLDAARNKIASVQQYDVKLQELFTMLDSTWLTLEETRRTLGEYLSNDNLNPERLDEVQERLDLLYKLKKKYGGNVETILEYLQQTTRERDELALLDENINKKEKECHLLRAVLTKQATVLNQVRTVKASEFTALVTTHIKDLAMEQGRFLAEFTTKKDFGSSGCDEVVFLFTANLGQEPKSLLKVASGGELSRVALAIKTVLLEKSGVPTMVFDEIDTGVGGITAQKMAEKIAIIAKRRQVLCITHLAQIACFADNHLYIEKTVNAGQTITAVKCLDAKARTDEIMRMTGGSNATSVARENAEQLLAMAEATKIALK